MLLLMTSLFLHDHLRAEDVVVELKDGRVIQGSVDRSRSDMQRLWIQQDSDEVSASAGFAWEKIESITAFERPIHRRRSVAATPVNRNSASQPVRMRVPRSEAGQASVRSIAFETAIANWDSDPAIDGMLLTLYPLDQQRRFTPAKGVVYATLHTWERDQAQTKLVPTERWSEHVLSENVFADGVEIQLPFRKLRNEKERFLRDSGLLRVRYSVPGMGSFQTQGVVPLSMD